MSVSIVTIEERKRYHIYVSAGRDEAGKRVRVSERFNGSKAAANKRARAIATDLDTGRQVARRRESFAAFVETWWATKQANVAPTTAGTYRDLLDGHALPALGDKDIQKIGPADIADVLRPLTEAGKARTAGHLLVVLGTVFRAALRAGAVGRVVTDLVEKPRPVRRELSVLSPADWHRVREHLERRDSWTLRPLSILLALGCRRCELAGLQWQDVDWNRRLVLIRRGYHIVGGRGVYLEPKSRSSRRAVSLDQYSLAVLADQRADAERLAAMFSRTVPPDDPVFTTANGSPIVPDSLSAAWSRIAKALGLRVRLHDLRHSAATLMLAGGVPVQVVSARLGHASAGFTLATYAHVMPGAQEDAAARLGAMLNGPPDRALPAPAGTAAAG